MAETIFYSILLIGIGALNLFYATKFLRYPQFAKRYIETSPKAWLWRKIFGVEKAIKITKSVFAPLGIILGVGFIIFGIILLVL